MHGNPETPTHASRESQPAQSNGNGTPATDKPKTISIIVVQDNNEITFKIKRNKPLQKVIDAYCKAKDIKDQKSVRFLFDNIRINADHTADSLEMGDVERIEVFYEQEGGSYWS